MLRSIVILAAAIALAIIVVNIAFQVVGALFQIAVLVLLGLGAYWVYVRIKQAAKRN